MSNASDLKELLRPLGVYKLEDSCLGALAWHWMPCRSAWSGWSGK